jgi:hypothetical protein
MGGMLRGFIGYCWDSWNLKGWFEMAAVGCGVVGMSDVGPDKNEALFEV